VQYVSFSAAQRLLDTSVTIGLTGMKLSLIIPTLNNAAALQRLLVAAKAQSAPPDEIIVVDSASDDNTVSVAQQFGVRLIRIARSEFNHGSTRTMAGKLACGEVLLYMTDDAAPIGTDCFEKLLEPFSQPDTAAVFGRQLPAENATAISAHLRMFNYPEQSCRRTWQDRCRFGIKTAFLSNSFCAYRRAALEQAGWFREDIIIAEDMRAGMELLKGGGTIVYNAQACVRHSHNLGIVKEFSRYFDIGTMHICERTALSEFGRAEGEGKRYVLEGLAFLPLTTYPEFFIRTAAKYAGYLLGKNHRFLPHTVCRHLSLNRWWWLKTV